MENAIMRNDNNKISTKKDVANAYSEFVKKCFEDVNNEMSDEEKQRIEERIRAKLKMGKKLSSKEMEYLRKYNPLMYQRALRIQKMAEMVEEQLKHAKSKEEANNIVSQAIGGISDKDPDKECIVAAINRVAGDFRKSSVYNRLPNTNEEARKMKDKSSEKCYNKENSESDADDLFGWTPLQEVIDELPKFSMNA